MWKMIYDLAAKKNTNSWIRGVMIKNEKCLLLILDGWGTAKENELKGSAMDNAGPLYFHELKNINMSLSALTKINCLLVKKALEKYYKKKITFKKPNDLLINKDKISGILQEVISKSDNKYLIVGIGINLIKSPKIINYPTTNLFNLLDKRINKKVVENELKVLFEKNLSKLYKINRKLNKI